MLCACEACAENGRHGAHVLRRIIYCKEQAHNQEYAETENEVRRRSAEYASRIELGLQKGSKDSLSYQRGFGRVQDLVINWAILSATVN